MLRLPAVLDLTGLCKEAIRQLELKGEFPRRRKLTARTSAWREDEVREWIDSRPKPPAAA
jgi:prophage regulatory protein